MNNPLLKQAILRVIYRLDPIAVVVETLAAEVDLALPRSERVTVETFRLAISELEHGGIVERSEDGLLGREMIRLTEKGREAVKAGGIV